MLCLLGPAARVSASGVHPLRLRPKALALLARLALVDEPQERVALAELLFPEAADPRDSLRWHLSYLRARVPEVVSVAGARLSTTLTTDVDAFRSGVERILDGADGEGAEGTLGLYRGDLCAGLRVEASADFHNWLYVEEDELRRLFRRAVLAFARRALADGRAAAAIPPLQRLTTVDPYLEDAHVLLVETMASAADETHARAAYDRYQRIVRTELHAEPRPELALRYERERPLGRSLPLDELVPLQEITMHVLEWPGEEPAIVAIHGSGGLASRFANWGERLVPAVRVVAVDLRGHGFSDKPPSGYGVDDHVQDLLQLIAVLGLRRPIVLGHSLGGSIATFVAAAAGERIGGLVLLDAVVGDRAFMESASFVLDSDGPSHDQRFRSFEGYHSLWAAERDDSYWRRWLDRNDRMGLAPLPDGTYRPRALRQALAEEWGSVAQRDALEALSSVSVPVLVVHADAPWTDVPPYLDPATIRAQLAAAPNARLYVAHGQNHAHVISVPTGELVAAVRTFAQEVRATG
jgi:pimeloyl-ACP methyl ester carboxylesterase/DNA-binding SARP family transcriptional activator